METKVKFHVIFLILHYRDISLTVSAVKALLNIAGNSKIVIVDNSNLEGESNSIKGKLDQICDMDIVETSENLGFSKGNNWGYEYIKKNYDFDFLVVMNNDVFIEQHDFIEKVDNLYQNTSFAIAGPDVYVPQRDFHSSPMRNVPIGLEDIKRINNDCYSELEEISKRFSVSEFIKYIKRCKSESFWVKRFFFMARKAKGQIRDYKDWAENCVLQGACLIFSRSYTDEMNYLFKPLTYMYLEEDILVRECIKNKMKIVYCPNLKVNHLCEGSLQLGALSYSQYCETRKTVIKRQLEANCIYSEEYLGTNNKNDCYNNCC
jgi:GT2 family glycosyltransferase